MRQDNSARAGHRIVDNDRTLVAFADTYIEIDIWLTLEYRVGWMQENGLVPDYEASMFKAFNSELTQRQARRAINILRLYGGLTEGSARTPMDGAVGQEHMRTVPSTIAVGRSEVQRNMIATRGLGLPRG